mgnify:CR=1 FL=1
MESFIAKQLSIKLLAWLTSRWAFLALGPLQTLALWFINKYMFKFVDKKGTDLAIKLVCGAVDDDVKTISDLLGRGDATSKELTDGFYDLGEL